MPKAVKNFDEIVVALASYLDFDIFPHEGEERFIIFENDDNTLEWKIERNAYYSQEKFSIIIPDSRGVCLEDKLYSCSLEEIAGLMKMSTSDLLKSLNIEELADDEKDEDDIASLKGDVITELVNADVDTVNKLILATGGIVKDYYQEAENLLISAGYTC